MSIDGYPAGNIPGTILQVLWEVDPFLCCVGAALPVALFFYGSFRGLLWLLERIRNDD